MTCDRLPQHTTKHSTPKLPNMSRSVINFFYQSPLEDALWSINLIMIQYESYTSLINHPVFQVCHLLLERKKCFLPQQIPLAYTKHLVISILEEEWWARVVTPNNICPSFLKTLSSILSLCNSTECLYPSSSYPLTCIKWVCGSFSSSPPLILMHVF